MEITVPVIKYEKVELSDLQMFDIMKFFCKQKLNFNEDMFISDDGNVMQTVEYHTSHSWFEKEFVRKATETDYAYFHIIKKLADLMNS